MPYFWIRGMSDPQLVRLKTDSLREWEMRHVRESPGILAYPRLPPPVLSPGTVLNKLANAILPE